MYIYTYGIEGSASLLSEASRARLGGRPLCSWLEELLVLVTASDRLTHSYSYSGNDDNLGDLPYQTS